MQLFITFLHVVLCFILILVILLQPGKDGASVFGGGGSGNQMYGPRGQANLLGRATTGIAVLFMFTSITLALYSSRRLKSGSDIEDELKRFQQEASQSKGAPAGDGADAAIQDIPAPFELELPTGASGDLDGSGLAAPPAGSAGGAIAPTEATGSTSPGEGEATAPVDGAAPK